MQNWLLAYGVFAGYHRNMKIAISSYMLLDAREEGNGMESRGVGAKAGG